MVNWIDVLGGVGIGFVFAGLLVAYLDRTRSRDLKWLRMKAKHDEEALDRLYARYNDLPAEYKRLNLIETSVQQFVLYSDPGVIENQFDHARFENLMRSAGITPEELAKTRATNIKHA